MFKKSFVLVSLFVVLLTACGSAASPEITPEVDEPHIAAVTVIPQVTPTAVPTVEATAIPTTSVAGWAISFDGTDFQGRKVAFSANSNQGLYEKQLPTSKEERLDVIGTVTVNEKSIKDVHGSVSYGDWPAGKDLFSVGFDMIGSLECREGTCEQPNLASVTGFTFEDESKNMIVFSFDSQLRTGKIPAIGTKGTLKVFYSSGDVLVLPGTVITQGMWKPEIRFGDWFSCLVNGPEIDIADCTIIQ